MVSRMTVLFSLSWVLACGPTAEMGGGDVCGQALQHISACLPDHTVSAVGHGCQSEVDQLAAAGYLDMDCDQIAAQVALADKADLADFLKLMSDTSQESGLRLEGAGEEPRSVARYEFGAGPAYDVELNIDLQGGQVSSTVSALVTMPTLRLIMTVEPLAVDGDGNLEYTYRMSAPAGEFGDVFNGLTGTGVMSPTGRVQPGEFHLPAGELAPEYQMFLESLGQAASWALPLPEEAVGMGATWRKDGFANLPIEGTDQSVSVSEKTLYRLQAMEPGQLTVDQETAIATESSGNGVLVQSEQGVNVYQTGVAGRIAGRMAQPLDRPSPCMTVDSVSAVTYRVEQGAYSAGQAAVVCARFQMQPLDGSCRAPDRPVQACAVPLLP